MVVVGHNGSDNIPRCGKHGRKSGSRGTICLFDQFFDHIFIDSKWQNRGDDLHSESPGFLQSGKGAYLVKVPMCEDPETLLSTNISNRLYILSSQNGGIRH